MTIFKDINELKKCALEMEEYFQEDYTPLMEEIDRVKSLDLRDETKQNICNGEMRKILIRRNITPSYKIVDWLTEKREEYLDKIAYFERVNEWEKKKNLIVNTE